VFEISFAEIIGLCAGALTAFSSVPQTYRIIKLKKADSVSLTTYMMLNGSCILWLTYGIIQGSLSIVFWNVISIMLTGTVIALKLLDMRKT